MIAALDAPRGRERLQRGLLWAMIAVGVLDTWFYRQWNASPDGVSYVDIARAFAARGPAELINGYWSPLYPAIMGVVLKIAQPTMETIYPAVRLVGLAVYVVAVFAFARLMRVLVRVMAARSGAGTVPWAIPAFIATGWALFFLLVSQATGLHLVTPDVGVAAVFFLVLTELIALDESPWNASRWVRLGAVCAIGYWWKAILFPVSALALLIAGWIARRRKMGVAGPALASVTFGALALVVAIPVSVHVGRATFGETGRVNQLWFVSNVPMVSTRCIVPAGRLARGDLGVIARDSVLHDAPLTCATTSPVAEATLPMWFSPSTYYAGVRGKLNVAETAVAARNNVGYLREALGEHVPFTAIAFVAIVAMALATRRHLLGGLPIGLLCTVPIAAYLVVYVELRHVVPFLIGLGLIGLVALVTHNTRWSRALVAIAAVSAGGETVVRLATQQRAEVVISLKRALGLYDAQQLSLVAARELRARGLAAGDRVATVNTMWNVDWAQRAGLVVRAYVPEYTYPVDRALRELGDPCMREAFFGALRALEIRAVVVRDAEGLDVPEWFTPLGSSGYRVGLVAPPDAALSCPATRSSSGTAGH